MKRGTPKAARHGSQSPKIAVFLPDENALTIRSPCKEPAGPRQNKQPGSLLTGDQSSVSLRHQAFRILKSRNKGNFNTVINFSQTQDYSLNNDSSFSFDRDPETGIPRAIKQDTSSLNLNMIPKLEPRAISQGQQRQQV